MNINGIIYERTTNSNGAATLLINLQAGEYIITTQYGTEQYSNTILIEAY